MKDSDSKTLKYMKMVIKSDLSRRYQDDDVKIMMNNTTFLDPRYKELPFLSTSEKDQVIKNVKVELCSLLVETLVEEGPEEVAESNTDNCDEPPTKRCKESLMCQLLGDVFSSKMPDHQLA